MGDEYHPNAKVLQALKHVTFVAVIGPTAAGKNTIIEAAMVREPRLHFVRNNTSREPREHERREGGEYRFLTREAMEERIKKGEYAQVAPAVFGPLYATAPEDYNKTGVATMPVLAQAVPIFRKLPFKAMRTVYVLPPDWETWQARIKRHGFDEEQLKRRLQEAERSLVFALEDEDTHLVINYDVEPATDDFILLALGKPLPPRLQADQSRGRQLAQELLTQTRKLL
jgi:guanylate kinase